MEEQKTIEIHWSFWVIGIVMLIWNVLGAVNFVVQMIPNSVEVYRETEQALIISRPFWATAAFAVTVFGGAVGCLLMLLRKKIAYIFFLVSFLGVVVTMVHSLSVDAGFGTGELMGLVLMPLLVAAFLVFYSKFVERKGWLH